VRVSSVTLEEVLTAAAARAASLVPETSGYLALAVGDATSRLPFRVEDRAVTLTTEGSVVVARGDEVVAPAESARVLRDLLSRLLARSVGTMPGLSAAGRTRDNERDTEAVVGELEAALIPVNRAAARRALARLARETLKAKESGRLRRRAARAPAVPAPAAIAAASPPAAAVEIPARALPIAGAPAPAAPAAAATAAAHVGSARREGNETGGDAVDVLFADTPLPVVAAAAADPEAPAARTPLPESVAAPAPAVAELHVLEGARSPTPLAEAVDAAWPEPSVPILLVARPAEVATSTTPVLGGMAVSASVDAVEAGGEVPAGAELEPGLAPEVPVGAPEQALAGADVEVELHFTATPAPTAPVAAATPAPALAMARGTADARPAADARSIDDAPPAVEAVPAVEAPLVVALRAVVAPPVAALPAVDAPPVLEALPVAAPAAGGDRSPVAALAATEMPLETVAPPPTVEPPPAATPGDVPAAEPTPTALGVAWSEMELAGADACPMPPPVAATPSGAASAARDPEGDDAPQAAAPAAPRPVMPRPRGTDRRSGPRRRDGELVGASDRGQVRPASEVSLGAAPKSNVDDLLDSFSSSSRTFADERAVRAVAAGLKTMAGLEPTPLPPGVSLPSTPTPPPAATSVAPAPEMLVPAGPSRRSWLVPLLVLLVCAAATSGLLLAFPELLATAG
jgi:hypothetical protein